MVIISLLNILDKANHSILLKNTWVFACVVVTRLRVYSVKTQSRPKRLSIFTEITEKKIKLTINSDKEAVSTCWNQKQFG